MKNIVGYHEWIKNGYKNKDGHYRQRHDLKNIRHDELQSRNVGWLAYALACQNSQKPFSPIGRKFSLRYHPVVAFFPGRTLSGRTFVTTPISNNKDTLHHHLLANGVGLRD
jgi:hypothetical protein